MSGDGRDDLVADLPRPAAGARRRGVLKDALSGRAGPSGHGGHVTDIAYHPTRLRALRDQFRALRAAEFPWTADTVYLNNASIGPIPERTRRVLDEFTAKRTAPHLLPDRELQAGLQAARVAVARLLNANPAEIALATNTSHGLNLAASARSEEHTSELQSRRDLVCRHLLEKKKKINNTKLTN